MTDREPAPAPDAAPNAATASRVCACMSLRQATRAVTQFYDQTMQESELRVTQLALVRTLASLGPVSIGALAEKLVMDRTTLTRNLKPLLDKGFIAVREGRDRRSREVELSERGRKALARAMPLWAEAQARFVEALGEEAWGGLHAGREAAVATAQEQSGAGRGKA